MVIRSDFFVIVYIFVFELFYISIILSRRVSYVSCVVEVFDYIVIEERR